MKIWQTCPKCDGWGKTSGYDGFYATSEMPCPICNGAGIISIADGEPPSKYKKQSGFVDYVYRPTNSGDPLPETSKTTSGENE